MTYKEAYEKIIQAYFKDEIKPLDTNFCFCGTLQGGRQWARKDKATNYTLKEYGKMEKALFSTFPIVWISPSTLCHKDDLCSVYAIELMPNFEDLLFSGMCAALDVLKEIHRSRGENVDDVQVFTKRELVK